MVLLPDARPCPGTGSPNAGHHNTLRIYQRLLDSATYGYIGHYYEKKGAYDSALHYQQQALALYDDLRHRQGKSQILSHIGSIYEDLKIYPQAQHYFQLSLLFNQPHGDPLAHVRILDNLGNIAYKTRRYTEANRYLQQGSLAG